MRWNRRPETLRPVPPQAGLRRRRPYRGRRLRDPEAGRDSFAVHGAWVLLNLLAANRLEIGRTQHARAAGRRRGRECFRQWLLKVAVRVTLGSR